MQPNRRAGLKPGEAPPISFCLVIVMVVAAVATFSYSYNLGTKNQEAFSLSIAKKMHEQESELRAKAAKCKKEEDAISLSWVNLKGDAKAEKEKSNLLYKKNDELVAQVDAMDKKEAACKTETEEQRRKWSAEDEAKAAELAEAKKEIAELENQLHQLEQEAQGMGLTLIHLALKRVRVENAAFRVLLQMDVPSKTYEEDLQSKWKSLSPLWGRFDSVHWSDLPLFQFDPDQDHNYFFGWWPTVNSPVVRPTYFGRTGSVTLRSFTASTKTKRKTIFDTLSSLYDVAICAYEADSKNFTFPDFPFVTKPVAMTTLAPAQIEPDAVPMVATTLQPAPLDEDSGTFRKPATNNESSLSPGNLIKKEHKGLPTPAPTLPPTMLSEIVDTPLVTFCPDCPSSTSSEEFHIACYNYTAQAIYGSDEYWKSRALIRFNPKLVERAKEVIQQHQLSNAKTLAIDISESTSCDVGRHAQWLKKYVEKNQATKEELLLGKKPSSPEVDGSSKDLPNQKKSAAAAAGTVDSPSNNDAANEPSTVAPPLGLYPLDTSATSTCDGGPSEANIMELIGKINIEYKNEIKHIILYSAEPRPFHIKVKGDMNVTVLDGAFPVDEAINLLIMGNADVLALSSYSTFSHVLMEHKILKKRFKTDGLYLM